MGSKRKAGDPGKRIVPGILSALFSKGMIAAVWLPVVVISVFHYGTSHHHHWVHDILRRAYYLPIVIASVRLGLAGGLVTAGVITLAYLPHAFLSEHHFDPARGLEKALEIALYFIVAFVAGYLADQERRRRAELQVALDEQQKLTKQLVRAGRLGAIGEVVAGVAHEIKNPLHALAGTAEIVDPLIPEEAEERPMWQIHRSEIDRLGRVAERFLSFARPAPLKAERIDLIAVARRMVELTGAQARQHRIDLQTALDRPVVVVEGDLDQLAQIALNIAVNGIKAIGDREGVIRVSVGERAHNGETRAFLSIENNGPPIAPDEMEHLFDPFHSGDDGTGLGLSISARIAEQHGGYIEVENGGLGIIFTLYLPLV